MVGEDVLEKHKVYIVQIFIYVVLIFFLKQEMLKDLVKKRFREKASTFLDFPQTL